MKNLLTIATVIFSTIAGTLAISRNCGCEKTQPRTSTQSVVPIEQTRRAEKIQRLIAFASDPSNGAKFSVYRNVQDGFDAQVVSLKLGIMVRESDFYNYERPEKLVAFYSANGKDIHDVPINWVEVRENGFLVSAVYDNSGALTDEQNGWYSTWPDGTPIRGAGYESGWYRSFDARLDQALAWMAADTDHKVR